VTPSVTVLVAVYNGGVYLREAVESVLAQTFTDFELLIVDDASGDDTPAYLASLTDARVRVLRNEENVGQAPSLNRGLLEARGRYVARLDADDRMLPTRLERQVAVLDAEPDVALVGTWIDVVDESGTPWATVRGDIRAYAEFIAATLANVYPFGHPSIAYRRDVVTELGGYDASVAPAEDKDLYRRLALARREIRVVREPLVRYRRHAAQLSQAQHTRQLAGDNTGMERYLTAVAPGADAGGLRLFLETGVGSPALLDGWLDAACVALRLSPGDREQLERAVARKLAVRAARKGPTAGPALRWAAARDARLYAFVPLAYTAAVRRRARTLASSSRTESLRRVTRRSRLLRRIYANLE
jgi:GT2 family glycosyltransferase